MRPEFVKDGNVEFFSCIRDRSTVAISGFNLATTPEDLILDLFDNYIKTGHPNKILVETDALPAAPGRALDIVFKKMFELNDYNFSLLALSFNAPPS